MKLKIRSIVKGMATWVPGLSTLANSNTGGTVSSRYCYSVWMRHLCATKKMYDGFKIPKSIAELGPGDSIGIGLSAILSGADEYYALDSKPFAKSDTNLVIFKELQELFESKADIPGDDEFPGIYPKLDGYQFPEHILDSQWMQKCLGAERVADIRATLEGKASGRISLKYIAPWDDNAEVLPGSVDWICSQAVLEHVGDIKATYGCMYKWLRPNGYMSHAIDYTSHGLSKYWNGHWTASDFLWKIVRGKRTYLINRVPHSGQVEALQAAGFRLIGQTSIQSSPLPRKSLAKRFRDMSKEDLETSSTFVVAEK